MGACELTPEDLSAVRSVWKEVLAASGAADLDALAGCLSAHHVNLDPRVAGPIQGRDAWQKWAEGLEYGNAALAYDVLEIAGSGDLAYVVWAFTGGWTEGDQRTETSGKGLSLFRREADGAWRFSRRLVRARAERQGWGRQERHSVVDPTMPLVVVQPRRR